MILSAREEQRKKMAQDTSPTIYKVKTPSGKWKILDNAEQMFNGVGKITDPDTNKVFEPKEYVPISSHDFAVQPPKRKKKAEKNESGNENIYHNFRRNESEVGEEIIFCAKDEESSSHYGKIHLTFDSSQPNVKLDNGDALKAAADYYNYTEEEMHDEVYPENIVSSAGVWDDIDFINYLYDNNYFFSNDAIITPDGAVVFDKKFMKRVAESNMHIAEEMSTVEIDQIGYKDTTDDEDAIKRRKRKIRHRYTQEEGIDDVMYEGTEGDRNKYKNVLNQDDMADIRINDNALPLVNFPIGDIVLSMLDKKAYPWFDVHGKTIDVELEKVPEENRHQFLSDFINNKVNFDGVYFKDLDISDKRTIHDIYMNIKINIMKNKKKVAQRIKLSLFDKAEDNMLCSWATPDNKYIVGLGLNDLSNEYRVTCFVDGEEVEKNEHKELATAMNAVTNMLKKFSNDNNVFFEQKEEFPKKKMKMSKNKPILNTINDGNDKENLYDYPMLHDQMNTMQER
jgi:hypothetical protein